MWLEINILNSDESFSAASLPLEEKGEV